MSKSCRLIEDLLVASTLHALEPEEQARLNSHLQECPDCRRTLLALQEDDRRLTAYVKATDPVMSNLEGRVMNEFPSHAPGSAENAPEHSRWTHRGWFRFAVAAAAVAVVAVGLYFIGGGPGTGIAWAQVIERVVEAQDYICRIEKHASISPDMDMVQYCSGEYGVRQDLYVKGKNVTIIYVNPRESEVVTLIHEQRKYAIMELNELDKQRLLEGSSAQAFVEFFRGEDYTDLGTKTIDGVQAVGIETTAMEDVWGAMFEKVRVRLWVDARTQWPVELEFEGEADGGKTWMKQIMRDFQWNAALSAADFAYEIPSDYDSVGNIPRAEATEESAVEGLRTFARLIRGTYPKKLVFTSAVSQFEREEPKLRKKGLLNDADIMDLLSIQISCQFYADLEQAGSDPAYYGEQVDPTDFDKVLLRWRLDDGGYRVIYGDLRAETVSADRLLDLERRR